MQDYKKWLVERFIIERKRFDRSGVYAYTQRAIHQSIQQSRKRQAARMGWIG